MSLAVSPRSGLIGAKPISEGRLRTKADTRAAISRVIIPTDRKVILQPMTLLIHARGALAELARHDPGLIETLAEFFRSPANTARSREESDRLLEYLFSHIETPNVQVRFRWRNGSVAMWDNRCTQHFAVADYLPAYRRMHRVIIETDRRA